MTERFHAESRRRRVSPVAVIVGVIVAGFVAALAAIFLGGEDPAISRARFEESVREAARLADLEKADAAIAEYKKALAIAEGDERLSTQRADIRLRIREIEEGKRGAQEAARAIQTFDRLCEDTSRSPIHLRDEAIRLKNQYGAGDGTLDRRIAEQDARIKRLRDEDEAADFPRTRIRIIRERVLEDRGKADWSGAVGDWQKYVTLPKVTEESRAKAREEVRSLQAHAREAFLIVKKKAERLAAGGEKAAAREELEAARPRFAATHCAEEMQKLAEEVGK
jgi:hypothetical protein